MNPKTADVLAAYAPDFTSWQWVFAMPYPPDEPESYAIWLRVVERMIVAHSGGYVPEFQPATSTARHYDEWRLLKRFTNEEVLRYRVMFIPYVLEEVNVENPSP